MSTTVTFRDHEEFQRAAIHMAMAGGLGGLAVCVLSTTVPRFGPVGGAWALAALMGAAAFGATTPASRTRIFDLVLISAVVLTSGVALSVAGATGFGLAALAAGFGVLVARGGRRFIPTLIVAAAALVLCRFVYGSLLGAATTAGAPLWLAAAGTGAAFAFVGVLGLLPRHVDIAENRVAAAQEASRTILTGEVKELADRAVALWHKVDATLERDAPARKAIEDSVLRLFDVARRWAGVEADGARTPADLIATRMETMTAKMERTEDPVARAQYARAHEALAEQARYLKEIGAARERVLARMHHYLAAMERLRFAVINHRSADASRISTDVAPILEDIADLGKEIDLSSEALSEIEKES